MSSESSSVTTISTCAQKLLELVQQSGWNAIETVDQLCKWQILSDAGYTCTGEADGLPEAFMSRLIPGFQSTQTKYVTLEQADPDPQSSSKRFFMRLSVYDVQRSESKTIYSYNSMTYHEITSIAHIFANESLMTVIQTALKNKDNSSATNYTIRSQVNPLDVFCCLVNKTK